MRRYPFGQEVTITGTFRVSGVLRDPGSNPDDQLLVATHQRTKTEIILSPQKQADGVWQAFITPTKSGEWRYRWRVFSPFETAQKGSFYIET